MRLSELWSICTPHHSSTYLPVNETCREKIRIHLLAVPRTSSIDHGDHILLSCESAWYLIVVDLRSETVLSFMEKVRAVTEMNWVNECSFQSHDSISGDSTELLSSFGIQHGSYVELNLNL